MARGYSPAMPLGPRSVIPLLLLSSLAAGVGAQDGLSGGALVAAVSTFAPTVRDFAPASEVAPSFVASPAPSPTEAPREAAAPVMSAEPTAVPVVRVAPTPRPNPSVAIPAETPSACPVDWFCYPRVGVRGPIVPYTDCSGSTDAGTSIRAFTCLSPRYLLGHAYTQMGRITGWQQGDVVFAYGQAFTVTGAITARSCDAPPLPLAPLSMQTSLSPNACGAVLIVQAR